MTEGDRLQELAFADEPRSGTASRFAFVRPGDPEATEILLIRHAQMPETTDPNLDQPLTPLGIEQAAVLAAYLATKPLAAVYASPTLRTRQTAAAIARDHGLEVLIDDDLRELEAYFPEGKGLADVFGAEEIAAVQAHFGSNRRWEVFRGYRETGAAAAARLSRAVEAIIERHPGGRVAAVSHGPMINAYLAGLLASPYDMLFPGRLTSVSVVLAKDSLRTVLVANSVAHFQTY